MYLVLNLPEFEIYQDSEYSSCSEYARILNIPGFSNRSGLHRAHNMPE